MCKTACEYICHLSRILRLTDALPCAEGLEMSQGGDNLPYRVSDSWVFVTTVVLQVIFFNYTRAKSTLTYNSKIKRLAIFNRVPVLSR